MTGGVDSQPEAVRGEAESFCCEAFDTPVIQFDIWRIAADSNPTDIIYEYCSSVDDEPNMRRPIVRVHWHTCCQDHPHQVTKVEVIRGT